jgi:Fe-S-cluster containining protein
MGEAKRRRQAGLSQRQAPGGGRPAGQPSELLQQWFNGATARLRGISVTAHVPCNGCTACCHQRIDINPVFESVDEAKRHLEMTQDEYGYCLQRRDDGACIHLGPEGCTVYEHRPISCRAYDCRIYALAANGGPVPVAQGRKYLSPAWEFHIRSERDAMIRDAFLLGAAPWLLSRRRDDSNTIMHAVLTKFRHHMAIVNAMIAKVELQPETERGGCYQQGMRRLFNIAARRALTMGDI